ncbi:MAG: hypothetical protein H7A37_04730 [Chlamydiales bacterium]|nr:hypothetical protein [Chlamydiia bacterium]MCP5507588.1 hypothetical protein [Chlamydiales bacterium]
MGKPSFHTNFVPAQNYQIDPNSFQVGDGKATLDVYVHFPGKEQPEKYTITLHNFQGSPEQAKAKLEAQTANMIKLAVRFRLGTKSSRITLDQESGKIMREYVDSTHEIKYYQLGNLSSDINNKLERLRNDWLNLPTDAFTDESKDIARQMKDIDPSPLSPNDYLAKLEPLLEQLKEQNDKNVDSFIKDTEKLIRWCYKFIQIDLMKNINNLVMEEEEETYTAPNSESACFTNPDKLEGEDFYLANLEWINKRNNPADNEAKAGLLHLIGYYELEKGLYLNARERLEDSVALGNIEAKQTLKDTYEKIFQANAEQFCNLANSIENEIVKEVYDSVYLEHYQNY